MRSEVQRKVQSKVKCSISKLASSIYYIFECLGRACISVASSFDLGFFENKGEFLERHKV
jgi:hypothetical protein